MRAIGSRGSLIAIATTACACGGGFTPTNTNTNTTTPGAVGLPSDNAWNLDVSTLPVHPNSANFIQSIGAATGLPPAFGTVYNGAPNGIPYSTVTARRRRSRSRSWPTAPRATRARTRSRPTPRSRAARTATATGT